MFRVVIFFITLVALPAQALTLRLPSAESDLVGEVFSVRSRYEHTLASVARAYGLGFREILAANPDVNPWVPGEGTQIVLPVAFLLPKAERRGVVLNLPEMRMYYYLDDRETVLSYPIGIGREGWETPEMKAKVVSKIVNPTWTPTQSIREEHASMGDPLPHVVPPGPDNPLGKYAVQLDAPGFFLHGTNKDLGVGMRVSHGCVRLYPEDIEEFVFRVQKGTGVVVVNQPVKAGWHRDGLYVEVHEPLEEQRQSWDALAAAREAIQREVAGREVRIDDEKLVAAAAAAQGVPVKVSLD